MPLILVRYSWAAASLSFWESFWFRILIWRMASSSFMADFWSSMEFMTSNSASFMLARSFASRKLSAMRLPRLEKSVELMAETKVPQAPFMPAIVLSQMSPRRWDVCAKLSAIFTAAAAMAAHAAIAPTFRPLILPRRPPSPETCSPASFIPLSNSSFFRPSLTHKSPIFIVLGSGS